MNTRLVRKRNVKSINHRRLSRHYTDVRVVLCWLIGVGEGFGVGVGAGGFVGSRVGVGGFVGTGGDVGTMFGFGVGVGTGALTTSNATPTCIDSPSTLTSRVPECFPTDKLLASAVTWIVWNVPG